MSVETISNNKIVKVPFGKGVFKLNNEKIMQGNWKSWKLIKGKTTLHGKVINVKN